MRRTASRSVLSTVLLEEPRVEQEAREAQLEDVVNMK